MSGGPGRIRTLYEVVCGCCQSESMTSFDHPQRQAAIDFRAMGWRKMRLYGWVCNACYPRLRDEEGRG